METPLKLEVFHLKKIGGEGGIFHSGNSPFKWGSGRKDKFRKGGS